MEHEIELLKEKYGSYSNVARALGITYRHLINVRNNKEISKPLEKLIKSLASDNRDGH